MEELMEQLLKQDNDNFILNKIKTKRNMQLQVGDVFVLEPIKGKYLFGRIVEVGSSDYRIARAQDTAVVFIYDELHTDMRDVPDSFETQKLLITPQIVDRGYWTRGWFYTVDNKPLTEIEQKLSYGFFYPTRDGMAYVDSSGENLMPFSEKMMLSSFGINTDIGILFKIKKQWVVEGKYELAGVSL